MALVYHHRECVFVYLDSFECCLDILRYFVFGLLIIKVNFVVLEVEVAD